MAVQANRQLQLKDSSGNELTSNAMTSTIRSVSVNNVMQALIPVGTSDGSSVLTKRIPVPVQVLQAGHSGDPKVKTMPSQYVRLIKTPNKALVNDANVVKLKTSIGSPAKGNVSHPAFLITTTSKLTPQIKVPAKLKVGDTITFPKATLLPDKVSAGNSIQEPYHAEVLSTPPKVIRVAESAAQTPKNNFVIPNSPNVVKDINIIHGPQITSPAQLATISPAWSQSPARNKRSSALNSSSQEPETKRRKTQNSDKGSKGLRHFAMLVCEKVKKKGTTTYNEVADELVAEYGEAHRLNMAEQHYDQKNIRRRVYDALNVLMAMNIIYKDKKDINWLGFPTDSAQELLSLQSEKRNREQRIEEKSNELRELILQQIAFKNLVQRNKRIQETQGIPEENSFIQLPFIIVNTSKKTVIDCSISNDKYEYMFNFDNTFEIHDDIEVLKRMGMAYGLESGSCSDEDLKTAQSILPPALKPFVEEMALQSGTNSNKVFSKYAVEDLAIMPKRNPDCEADDLSSCFSMEQVLDPDDQEVAMVTDVSQVGTGRGVRSQSSSSGVNSALYSLTPMSSVGSESRTSTPFDTFDS